MTIGTATPTRNAAGTVVRIVLTLVGAAMMVFGAFMHWVRGVIGTNLSWKAFYSTDLGRAITSSRAWGSSSSCSHSSGSLASRHGRADSAVSQALSG